MHTFPDGELIIMFIRKPLLLAQFIEILHVLHPFLIHQISEKRRFLILLNLVPNHLPAYAIVIFEIHLGVSQETLTV